MVLKAEPGVVRPLTRREHEVASLVADGLTNREIAVRLFISERTAESHVEQIRNKLGFRSRSQVAAWAVQREAGILAPDRATVVALPTVVRAPPLRLLALALASLLLASVAYEIGAKTSSPPAGGPVIETVAGIAGLPALNGDFSGDGGPASAAQLNHPEGLAIGLDGSLYVADEDNGALRKIDPRHNITTVAGQGQAPFTEGAVGPSLKLHDIVSVAVGSGGEVFFGSGGGNHPFQGGEGLLRLDPDTTVHRVLPLYPDGPLRSIGGIALRNGDIYLADTVGNVVWKWGANGFLTPYAGTGHPGFSGDGAAATGADLDAPVGLAFDAKGDLYVADSSNHRVRRVSMADGSISTIAGSSDLYDYGGDGGQATQAKLSFPGGLVFDRNGNLFIADTGNNRVRKLSRNGVISTVAGTGSAGFAGDGAPATAARLWGPGGLAIDSVGNLYVSDTAAQRIRVVQGVAG